MSTAVGLSGLLGDISGLRGHMTIERTVWCGLCVHWEQYSEPRQSGMNREVRARGWRKTRERGWICPNCVQINKHKLKDRRPKLHT